MQPHARTDDHVHRRKVTTRLIVAALSALAMVATTVTPSGAIIDHTDRAETVVGNPPLVAPPDGEGLPAEATYVRDARGVAVHPWTGELYWSDFERHRIRRLDRDGRVWSVAGDGTAGFSGDGGDAFEAQLDDPSGLAFDGDGNLYIADAGNHRIRRIDTLGFISTVAGGGSAPAPGYGDGLAAVDAELLYPTDVEVSWDGQNIYIADSGHHRIRRVNRGGVIFNIAGTTNGFSGDGGPARDAQLSSPESLALDEENAIVYVGDFGNRRVRSITEDGTIFTAAGNGTDTTTEGALATSTGIGPIRDIVVDGDGTLYITDRQSDMVRRIDRLGQIVTISGSGVGIFGSSGLETYLNPSALSFDPEGRLLVGDETSVVRITPDDPAPTRGRYNIYGRPAEDQVRRLYQAAFDRVPEAGGLRFWVEQYQNGQSMLEMAAAFIASGESIAIYGEDPSDEEFLGIVYFNVLGRDPDPGGFAFWLDRLAGGQSRASVLAAFADSPENIEGTRTAWFMPAPDMEVFRLYRAAFGRLPDAGGLDFWGFRRDQGESLESISEAFIASPEASGYLDIAEDSLFLTALYGNVLGRNPDDAGLTFWEGRMAAGMTRAEVLVEFSESFENKQRTGTA